MKRVLCMWSKRPDFAPTPSASTLGAAGLATCATDGWELINMTTASSPAFSAFDDADVVASSFIYLSWTRAWTVAQRGSTRIRDARIADNVVEGMPRRT